MKNENAFKVQQAIEKQIDSLVDMAEKRMPAKLAKSDEHKGMSTQFSNLLSVVKSSPSRRVVTNWLKYQKGRKDYAIRKKWQTNNLASDICNDIDDKIAKTAEKIANDNDVNQQEVEMILITQYAGYLRRSYVANGGRE